MEDSVISVENLSKRYRIGLAEKKSETLVEQIIESIKYPVKNFRQLVSLSKFSENEGEGVYWALRDLNFEVTQGEVLGVIGHNGAGKSTLLKILSRITEPTTGQVRIKGRVSSLLEVGTGFHPELTGRENIYMNGTILGMTRKEIDNKFDEIVDFSGIDKYIDTPVKRYSSGMKVRLGFSVAAHLEPEILIVDEVLAVGDLGFQRKCLGMMQNVSRSGRTVIFVSHNMSAVENLCSKGLLLHEGKISFHGTVKETVRKYIEEFKLDDRGEFLSGEVLRSGTGHVILDEFCILNTNDHKVDAVQTGATFSVKLGYKKQSPALISNVDVGFSVHDPEDDSLLFILYSSYTGHHYDVMDDKGYFTCRIDNLPLPEGRYLVKAQVMSNGTVLDFPKRGVGYLDVIDGDFFGTGVKGNRLTRQQPKFLIRGQWK